VTIWLNTPFEPRFRVIDGLAVRYAESPDRGAPALLLGPWPETILGYVPIWERLAERAHLVALDLPGFGHSQRRDELLSPRTMAEFVVRAADAFHLDRPHVVGPGVVTAAALFAAAGHPGRLRSLVVGSGPAAVPPEPDGSLPDAMLQDYLSAAAGDRFAAALAYVRACPADLQVLRELLPGIRTPVLIVTGATTGAEFPHHGLPDSRLTVLGSGPRPWQDAPAEYAQLVTDWWTERG
jgi:pimeloyl-ACP methyl ester carboxylesterase